jgi:hypothetical protein
VVLQQAVEIRSNMITSVSPTISFTLMEMLDTVLAQASR